MHFLMMMVLMCFVASTGFAGEMNDAVVPQEEKNEESEEKDKEEVKPDDAIKADVDAVQKKLSDASNSKPASTSTAEKLDLQSIILPRCPPFCPSNTQTK
ncbi:MAG: hypothetical protein K2X98_03985 [Alphaproteobacteria bacterium]|nr:hypothetical protein [Alphaproteobacteria bacterium]